MQKTLTNLDLNVIELPYSHGLLLKYKLIKERTEAPAVMRIMQRVAKHPSVAKKRSAFTIETILQQMSPRQLAALRRAVTKKKGCTV
jgi:hypothetical protein